MNIEPAAAAPAPVPVQAETLGPPQAAGLLTAVGEILGLTVVMLLLALAAPKFGGFDEDGVSILATGRKSPARLTG